VRAGGFGFGFRMGRVLPGRATDQRRAELRCSSDILLTGRFSKEWSVDHEQTLPARNCCKQAQRNSLTFNPVETLFDWDNETWALTFLPRIRLASALLNNDERGCEKIMADCVRGGLAPDMLEGWCETKKHLECLIKVCDVALNRSFLVLERLGYGPDNPPPDMRVETSNSLN
jgi:hypothetical protein